MVAELTLQLLPDPVDRRRHVLGFGLGEEGLAGDPQRRLDALGPVHLRVVLADQLEVQGHGPRLDPLERGELVLRDLAHLVGDRDPAAREGHLHRWVLLVRLHVRLGWAPPADLVFDPTPACRDDRPVAWTSVATELPSSRDAVPGAAAGLTSKPRHAQPPTVA